MQEAVSNCLPHLVTSPALEADIPSIVTKLLKQLLTAEKYGDRKASTFIEVFLTTKYYTD